MDSTGDARSDVSEVGRNVAAELVATTLVVLAGPGLLVLGGEAVGPLEVAVASGIAIALAIGVLGAVANPMFSLALWFARGISGREAIGDLVGQLLGAFLGAALIFGMNDTTRFATGTNGWEPNDGVDAGVDVGIHLTGFGALGVVIGAELVLATIVVVVLLSVITQQRSNATMAAFTGAAYAFGTLFLLPISGAGLNPARSLATAVFADTDPNALGQVWVFLVVPVVAAFAGMVVWLLLADATIDDTVFDDTVIEDLSDAITGD
jgi:aquaporin Z